MAQLLFEMDILLKRIARKSKYTIGKLYINGEYFCDTLEDTDRGLKQDMGLDEIKKIKVHSETAIPEGKYKIAWTYSQKYKRNMPLLLNVPGYEGIRIHSGNVPAHTQGCILLGQNKVVGQVINSKATCDKFYAIVKPACEKEQVYITIQ